MSSSTPEEKTADFLPSGVIRGGILGVVSLDPDAGKAVDGATDTHEAESANESFS
jgi:hypothetical protein